MTYMGANNDIRSLRRRRLVLSLAGALVVALTLPACNIFPRARTQATTPSTAEKSAAQVPPTGEEVLRKFYTQVLEWTDCGPNQCARLTVPIDYSRPDGDTVKLAVLKVEANRPSERIGSLLVNPGGPGAPATAYARAADFIVTKPVRAAYDIVGVDPRGVASSSPIKCLNDREVDSFVGSDPTPDDASEVQQFADTAKAFADKCKANGGPLLGHVSTIEAAKDMDVLRAVLGEPKLDFMGKSYGTYLGALYADLFPTKVGKFVLDGAEDPNLTSGQLNEGQAIGFENATRIYVQHCVDKGDCPLGDSLDSGMRKLRGFFKQVDTRPLPLDDRYVKQLTEGWASVGVAIAMYDEGLWDQLTEALRDAFGGDANPLMTLAERYAHRTDQGTYADNLMQVIYAVNCLDRPDPKDLSYYDSESRRLSAIAPTWGPYLARGRLPCAYWPVPPNNAPKKVTAAGSGPIVVVGTTRDPATPYKWAQALSAELENGNLITFDGDGHTAYTRSNSCVNDAVDAYLLEGIVPPAGLKC